MLCFSLCLLLYLLFSCFPPEVCPPPKLPSTVKPSEHQPKPQPAKTRRTASNRAGKRGTRPEIAFGGLQSGEVSGLGKKGRFRVWAGLRSGDEID